MSIEQVIRAYEIALNGNDIETILSLYSAEDGFHATGSSRTGEPPRVSRRLHL